MRTNIEIMNIISKGIQKGYIAFPDMPNYSPVFGEASESQITSQKILYIHQNKAKNYRSPEEKVVAETFLRLIFDYGYKPEHIKLHVPIQTSHEITRVVDIIIYKDSACLQPYILVECRRQEISEPEFSLAFEQAYSHAYALPNDIRYIWVTSGLRNEYFEVDKRRGKCLQKADIPQYGVRTPTNYKYVYNAEALPQEEGKPRFFGLSIIEEAELTLRFKQAHKALWGGGQLNPSEAFNELNKLIFCKIWDEKKNRQAGEPYDFQIITITDEDETNEQKCRQKVNDSLYKRVLALYEEGCKRDKEIFRDNIRLTPEKIRTVVEYLGSVNFGETDSDSKGRAFETFTESFFRGNLEQHFTPRQIVKFAIDVLPITNKSLVMDTSCGSGGFLLYALNKVRKQATDLYPKYKIDIKQNAKWYKYWHGFAANNLYGIEINEQISRVAKMNMIIHNDGHTNVITSDGLLAPQQISEKNANTGFQYNRFDFIVTNPPFGRIVHLTEQAYFKNYVFGIKQHDWLDLSTKSPDESEKSNRPNQDIEVLFIEQAYKFLKSNGYLAIVLPDDILTYSSLQYVRDYIEEWFRIIAVVSMPQTAFTAKGTGVKSSVVFLKKWSTEKTKLFISLKRDIAIDLCRDMKYRETVQALGKEKKNKLKNLDGFKNTTGITKLSELKKTQEYKEWRMEMSASYTEKLNVLKDELNERYLKTKQTKLPDYQIFMAIADNIGYDATGKPTAINELEYISQELGKFIANVEEATK